MKINSYLNNIFEKKVGINNRIKPGFLKTTHTSGFNKLLSKFITGQKLKNKVKDNISFLVKIKCYRGIRHKSKYPSRGQRTHTNAKTRKKLA
jgi:small subunit ribosomal protein S13|tara:strand:- start:4454 stop:4729 length:276 start_codon:yes stop_codon:yes gene_type:complete